MGRTFQGEPVQGYLMGLIFDVKSVRHYEAWYQSDQGRAVDRFLETAIPALLDPRSGERILDIGCGGGSHLLLMNRLGLDISGIDASPYAVSRARERLGHRSTVRTGRAEDLPFDDNEFDIALLINTLEFLEEPLTALKEAGRVARRGVFIGFLNSLSWSCVCGKLKGLFQETLFSHARFYNLWEVKSLIRTAFGDVPVAWRCTPLKASASGAAGGDPSAARICGLLPLGSFLGIYVTISYRLKTNQRPLKIKLDKAKQTVVSGITMEADPRLKGVRSNERSLSL